MNTVTQTTTKSEGDSLEITYNSKGYSYVSKIYFLELETGINRVEKIDTWFKEFVNSRNGTHNGNGHNSNRNGGGEVNVLS